LRAGEEIHKSSFNDPDFVETEAVVFQITNNMASSLGITATTVGPIDISQPIHMTCKNSDGKFVQRMGKIVKRVGNMIMHDCDAERGNSGCGLFQHRGGKLVLVALHSGGNTKLRVNYASIIIPHDWVSEQERFEKLSGLSEPIQVESSGPVIREFLKKNLRKGEFNFGNAATRKFYEHHDHDAPAYGQGLGNLEKGLRPRNWMGQTIDQLKEIVDDYYKNGDNLFYNEYAGQDIAEILQHIGATEQRAHELTAELFRMFEPEATLSTTCENIRHKVLAILAGLFKFRSQTDNKRWPTDRLVEFLDEIEYLNELSKAEVNKIKVENVKESIITETSVAKAEKAQAKEVKLIPQELKIENVAQVKTSSVQDRLVGTTKTSDVKRKIEDESATPQKALYAKALPEMVEVMLNGVRSIVPKSMILPNLTPAEKTRGEKAKAKAAAKAAAKPVEQEKKVSSTDNMEKTPLPFC